MLLVHGFAGAITTKYILDFKQKNVKKFNNIHLSIIWFLGIVGGIFPDFDIAYAYIDRLVEHRRLLTHSLIPYLIIYLLIFLIINLIKFKKQTKDFINIANLVFFFGVVSHLLLDYIAGGLELLSPITNYYFGYHLPFNAPSPYWQYMYFTSTYMIFEVSISLWFSGIFRSINNVVGKYLPVLLFCVATLATIAFMYF